MQVLASPGFANIYVKVSACVCHGEVNYISVSGRCSKGGGGDGGGAGAADYEIMFKKITT